MGFKYLTHFHRGWLKDPEITDPERKNATAIIDELVSRLLPSDQTRACILLAEAKPAIYWYQPEYEGPKKLLALAAHPIYDQYRLLSGSTHGGYSMKVLFNDDPNLEDIEPREHARNVPAAILASTRFLLEVCYIRDRVDNLGVGKVIYQHILASLTQLNVT